MIDKMLVDNAKYVIETPIPERFEWEGKGDEPEWFQDWIHEKAELVKKVALKYGYLPDMIMYWKIDRIKEEFPLEDKKNDGER